MRYFIQLSYLGAKYCGWQKQPESPSVQETLETAFSTMLRTPTELVGCGRTDTGVHARIYYVHLDCDKMPDNALSRLNKLLPPDIAIHQIHEVKEDAHARYDAFSRAYEYHLHFQKSPFLKDHSFLFPFPSRPDFSKTQAAAKLLLNYEEFFPFCKSNTDVKTMRCELKEARWEQPDANRWVFYIGANRFLRGMVRLIVGMSLNVGLGKVSIEEVQQAMEQQTRLKRSWSVPPEGLFLMKVEYPFLNTK